MTDVTLTPTLTISATAPSSPTPGDLWWNSAIGVFFVYYDDGTSVQWVTTQPVKYINLAEIKGPAGGQLTGYYPDPIIIDEPELEFPLLRNPLLLSDYTQRLASTKWVTDKFAESGVLGAITAGPGILLNPDPLAGDSTISLLPIPVDPSGTFGSASSTPVIQVDQYGRIIVSGSAAIPPINSPTFTGIPAAPTPGPSTNTTQIATTAFVQTTLTIALSAYAPLNSPSLTGVPTAPTAGPGTNTTQIATTAFVQGFIVGTYAPLNSPVFTGNPTAPTPAGSDDDTSIATTEWVRDLINFTTGGVIFSGATGYPTVDAANFFWDDTNNRLGIGNAAPTVPLDVTGAVKFGAALTVVGTPTIRSATAIPAGGTQDFGYLFSSAAHFGVIFGSGAPAASMARGSLYLRSDGTPYYNVDGATQWAPIGGSVTVSDTAPVSPLDGQFWMNSALMSLFIYYNDGNTQQWVPATPAPVVPTTVQAPWNVRATVADALSGSNNIPLFRTASTPVKDYDPQGVWDLANARFVAPSNGRYAFQLNVYATNAGAATPVAIYMVHSNSAGTLIRQYVTAQQNDSSTYGAHFKLGIELQMTSGDRMQFVIAVSAAVTINIGAVPGAVGGMPASGALTWASGHRIGD